MSDEILGFFLFVIVAIVLAVLGQGIFIPFLFVVYLIGGMAFEALRDGEGKGFAKIFLVPVILVGVFGFIISQCSNEGGGNRGPSSGLFSNSNSCRSGSWFDEFKTGGGQWRNPDGKFCSK